MPYRDDLAAAASRADAAERALASERLERQADRDRLKKLEAELREVRQAPARSPVALLLILLGVEFTAVVALAIVYLAVR